MDEAVTSPGGGIAAVARLAAAALFAAVLFLRPLLSGEIGIARSKRTITTGKYRVEKPFIIKDIILHIINSCV